MHNVNKNVYKGKKQFIHKTDKIKWKKKESKLTCPTLRRNLTKIKIQLRNPRKSSYKPFCKYAHFNQNIFLKFYLGFKDVLYLILVRLRY